MQYSACVENGYRWTFSCIRSELDEEMTHYAQTLAFSKTDSRDSRDIKNLAESTKVLSACLGEAKPTKENNHAGAYGQLLFPMASGLHLTDHLDKNNHLP